MQMLTRAGLLRRGAGVALAASAGGALARTAAADAPPDADLAWGRLLIATELLADDFYTRIAGTTGGVTQATLHEARANERAHYGALAAILSIGGQTPATAGDIDFSYPPGAFATAASITRLGAKLETLQLGAYLGAADALASEPLRAIAARIGANEAQHLTIFQPFHNSFPVSLTIAQASTALAEYTS